MNEPRIPWIRLTCLAGLALGAQGGPVRAQDYPPALPAQGRIVYTRQAVDTFDMFTADPDGTNEARLSDIDESPAGEDQPRWSPDGRRVAFATYRDGAAVIHVLDVQSGSLRTAVDRDGSSGDASWSPDGRCLAFEGGQADDPTHFDLKIWCDEGGSGAGAVRSVTNTPEIDERDPEWSPDGGHILFAARTNAAGSADRWALERIAPDGTGRRSVLALPAEHARFGRYRPDGEQVGFIASSQNLPFGTLSVLDPASGGVTALCDLASDSFSWSPDGTEMLFANIANAGVRLAVPGAASSGPASALTLGREAATQYKGLYRIDVASRSIMRLKGAGGGADAPNVPTNFEFGFMPDWTMGTATPPAAPTDPPTVEVTPTPPLPTATPTREPSPSATPTASATASPRAQPRIYLPRLFRPAPPRRR